MPTATRFARPSSSSAAYAADSCPLPPSISDQIGKRPALLEQLAVAPQHDFVHRREVVLAVGLGTRGWGLAAGLGRAAEPPSREPLIRNFRYSARRIRPSSHTTIDATVSLPWIVEMSKHSMRRGSAGSASTCCSVSSASYCAVCRLVEPRLVGERGVAVGEIDEAALLAALRHDDPHAAAGALGQPGLERLALVGLGRHVDLRRRAAQLVELLDRRLEHFRLRSRRRSPPRCRARCARRPGRCAPGRPGRRRRPGPSFRPNTSRCPSSAVAIFCWRSCSVCTVRIASRSCAASSKRSSLGGRRASAPAASSTSSSFLPSRNSRVSSTARPYSSAEQIGVDARRDAALDVVLEARPAALAGDHLVARADAEQPVRQRHRLAREVRRHERAGVEAAVALDAARHQHARKRLVGRQLQVGIVLVVAQQDVVFRACAA